MNNNYKIARFFYFEYELNSFVDDHGNTIHPCDLEFDIDWGLLMMVVEYIEDLDDSEYHYSWDYELQDYPKSKYNNFNGYIVDIGTRSCEIFVDLALDPAIKISQHFNKPKIECVYQCILDFIDYREKLIKQND